jgi:hypothetical protein
MDMLLFPLAAHDPARDALGLATGGVWRTIDCGTHYSEKYQTPVG